MRLNLLLILFVFCFDGRSAIIKAEQSSPGRSFLKSHNELKQHCKSCPNPSQELYRAALLQMENHVQLFKDSLFYSKSVDELTEGYLSLLIDYGVSDAVQSAQIIEKVSMLAKQRMLLESSPVAISMVPKELRQRYVDLTASQQVSSVVNQQFHAMLNQLVVEASQISSDILDGQSLKAYLRQQVGKEKAMPTRPQQANIIERLKLGVLTKTDQMLLMDYIDVLKYFEQNRSIITVSEYKLIFEILNAFVKNNDLSDEMRLKIRQSVTLACLHQKHKTYCDDIIWWVEAKDGSDQMTQLKFLNNQLFTHRKKDVLSILVSLGQVDFLNEFFQQSEGIQPDLQQQLMLSRAALADRIIQEKTTAAQSIVDEYARSVMNVVRQGEYSDENVKIHFNWLITQMARAYDIPEIEQAVGHLVRNNLYYNPQLTESLSPEDVRTTSEALDHHFDISSQLLYITETLHR